MSGLFHANILNISESIGVEDMKQIPNEILSNILMTHCELEFERQLSGAHVIDLWNTQSEPRHLKRGMLPISQVCKLWREIVREGSSFWVTTLIFQVYGEDENLERDIVQLRTLTMGSSGGSDIDLVINVHLLSNLVTYVTRQCRTG